MKKILTSIFFLLSFLIGVNATNFVSNGDFEASSAIANSYWTTTGSNHTYSIETSSPIAGSYSAKATINTAAAGYASQGLFTYVTLPKAATYTVTFTVKSSVDFTQNGTIGVEGILSQSYGGFTYIGTSSLNSLVANTAKTISFDVTTTTANTGLCKLGVYYGGLATNATILIDNVTVTEKTGTSLTNTNLCNGDFETVSGNGIYNPANYTYNGLTSGTPNAAQTQLYYGWSLDKLTSSTASMTAAIDNTTPLSGTNSMKLTSNGTATATTTDLQFDWVFGGIKDANYTVSFKAKTDAAGGYNLRVALQSWGGNYYINEQTCALTTTTQTFTLTSTATFAYSDGRNILRFLLGTLPNGVSVWLDDIVIAVKQTPTITWSQSSLNLKSTDVPYMNLTAATSNMSSVTTPAPSSITYSSDNTNVVIVNGQVLSIVGAGTANITASQSADVSGFYSAATPVSKSVTVNQNGYRGALISNGTFELGTDASSNVSWWQKTGSTGNFTYAIDNTSQISGTNSAKLTVTTAGASTSCALFQYMTLPKPSTYTVSFKAKASTACSIQAALVQSYQPFGWITGGSASFNLTTSTQTFSYDITNTLATGLCKFAFYFGNVLTDIYLDDVTIVEKTPLTNANMCNGDFETTMNNAIYAPTNYTYNGITSGTPDATANSLYFGWSLVKLTSSTAAMTATTETGVDKITGSQSIKLTSTGTATATSTDLQFAYVFAGIKDKQYNIYFKAKASTATTMGVALQAWSYSSSPSSTYLSEQTCNLTTSVQTFGFTTTNPFLQPDGRNILQFLLGKLPNGVSVWIDDVVIQPVQAAVTTPAISWSQSLTGLSVGSSPVSLTASSNYSPASSPAASSITYGSSNTAAITVSGSILTVVGAGTSNITAYQAADATGNYSAATAVVQSVTIAKATQTITVTPVGTYTYNGSPQGPNAVTKGGSTGAVTYSYVGVNTTVYTASSTQPTEAGSYTVTASVVADANYYAASSSATAFNITQALLTVSNPVATSKQYDGNNTAIITGSLSGIYNSDDVTLNGTGTFASIGVGTGIAVTSTSTLSGTKAGNYTLTQPTGLTADITAIPSTPSSGNLGTASTLLGTDVTVASGVILNVADNATVHSITVQPGGMLTLSDGKTLNAPLVLQNTGSATASFIDGNSSITPPVITASVQQDIPATDRNWYVSVPVLGKLASSITLSGSKIVTRNEANVSWDDVAAGTTLTPGVGYIAVGSASSGTASWNLSGNLKSGNVPVTLTASGASFTGFNLVGNPYPSYLNWEQVLNLSTANAALVQPTIWYRTGSWNNTTKKYDYTFQTYNSASRIAVPTSASGYIPPMQAFWVRANSGGTLQFTNAMRSHGDGTVGFGSNNLLKTKSALTLAQTVLRLQVNNTTTNDSDETVVYFNPNAQNGFDAYDSPKMMNNTANVPDLYTMTGKENLVINGLNAIPYDTEIPLGFAPGSGTLFQLKATELTNFDPGTRVILRDYLSPDNVVEQDLTDGTAYSFAPASAATTTTRFTLVFKSSSVTTGINGHNTDLNVHVFRNGNGQITISCPMELTGKATMSVYNAVGQKLESRLLTSTVTVLTKGFESGVYVVNVVANGKATTQKVVIN